MSLRIVHRISCNPKSNLFFKCNLDSMRWLKYTHIGWEFQCFVSINGIINRNRYDLIKLGFIENNCIWKWNDQPICVGHVNVYTKSDHRGNWQKGDSWWWYGLRCVCVCVWYKTKLNRSFCLFVIYGMRCHHKIDLVKWNLRNHITSCQYITNASHSLLLCVASIQTHHLHFST